MDNELGRRGAERRKLWITLRRLLGSYILLLCVLIIGYALAPVIGLLPETTIPILGFQLGTILFLIIGALLIYSLISFIRAVLNFLQLHPSVIAQHIPGLITEHPRTTAKLLFNIIMLLVILVAYWIFFPALYLIPAIGGQIAAGIQLAVAAVVVLFFWSLGSTIYKSLNGKLGASIEEHQGASGLMLLRRRILNVFIYLFITVSVMIVAYALFPAISLGAHIMIPNTGLAIGTLYWIIALAVVALSVFSLITNIVGLFGLGPEMLSKVFPSVNAPVMSRIKRFFLSLVIVIAVAVGFFIISPYLPLIPNIGNYLAGAGQVVVGAIVVLFFWDVGRTLQAELEKALRTLEE